MDQTRFMTVQDAVEVATQLYLSESERSARGHSFALSLRVPIPYQQNVELPLDLIVDRVDPGRQPDFVQPNGDTIVATVARLRPDGKPFDITVLFQVDGPVGRNVCVTVSPDMERIIQQQRSEDLDDEIDWLRESS